jgi:hypothetical protein
MASCLEFGVSFLGFLCRLIFLGCTYKSDYGRIFALTLILTCTILASGFKEFAEAFQGAVSGIVDDLVRAGGEEPKHKEYHSKLCHRTYLMVGNDWTFTSESSFSVASILAIIMFS